MCDENVKANAEEVEHTDGDDYARSASRPSVTHPSPLIVTQPMEAALADRRDAVHVVEG